MAAEDGLKAQKLLAQGVWDVAYDTLSFSCLDFELWRKRCFPLIMLNKKKCFY